MTYYNRTGHEYTVVGDQGTDFDSRRPLDAAVLSPSGLYSREGEFPILEANLEACLHKEAPYSSLSLEADQMWNETGWKEAHASSGAAARFIEKSFEECHEVDAALDEWWDTREKAHVVEELGDLKWCVVACASNLGIVVGDAIKSRMYDYAVGTRVQQPDGTFDYPNWYDQAAQFATKRESPTVGDIDELIIAGFVPRLSPAMNLYEEESISPTTYLYEFSLYLSMLKGFVATMYTPERSPFQANSLEAMTSDGGKIVAEMYLKIAAIAHYVGSTMETVVETNIDKISERIEKNLIDKSDGSREA